ncbi:Gfo/Idh/MocA family oxidoreductase, partial [Candidatus Sumerlaeota bacterium]|nr:Gfo/Idh/MocA family oxidoreductase [Candidatus Sumerlaeota bacterium]
MIHRSDRRRFFKQAIAVASAAGFSQSAAFSARSKGSAAAPGNKITIACIGVGGRGTANMRGFLQEDDARVVAVCDPYEDKRKKAKALVDKTYGDSACSMHKEYRELLDRKDIQAFMIATQDHWHAVIAVAAARAGKDMYCEKPLGVSVKECQAIRGAVRKHKRVFQTGTQQRSDPRFRLACELARNGYVGKIHTLQVATPGPNYKPSYKGALDPQPTPAGFDFNHWLGPAPEKPFNPGRVGWPDWYLIWDYCAGFIVNWGVHHLDIANWGCPEVGREPFEVECAASYRNEGLTDNVASWKATFTYGSGLR